MNALPTRLVVSPEGRGGEPATPSGNDGGHDDTGQMPLFPEVSRRAAPLPRDNGLPDHAADPLPGSAPPGLPDLALPEASLGERIVRAAYGMGVPASLLVAPFSKPPRPRIKATVESPPLGDRVAGMALRAGHFLIGGVKIPLGQADFAPGTKLAPPAEAVLHGFAWLRDLAASAPAPQCAAIAEKVMRAWLAANPEPTPPATAGAWQVETAGRRLLAWLVHSQLIYGHASGHGSGSGSGPGSGHGHGDKAYRAAVLEAIGETARWLDRHAARAADLHGEALAYAALTAAGLLLPEGKPRRLCGEAGLVRTLGAMVGEDGGVLSRSPLVQAEALAMLVELAACYRALRREPPEAIGAMVELLVPPLVSLAHADGSLGNWQGAGAISPARVEALVVASGARARPLREARDWGYQRLVAHEAVLVCDAAPPPLARHARSGCASSLAFEFSHGSQLLVVNCGGAALAGGQVPLRIEQGLRATAAHSTLVLGDANSTAVLIGGKLGKGVTAVEVDRAPVMLEAGALGGGASAGGPATQLALSHDGYAARFGLLHRRHLTLADDGTALLGEDRLDPVGRTGRRGKVAYALRFHLGPQVELRVAANGQAADLLLADGGFWRFAAGGAKIAAEDSLWVDGDGVPHPVQQLVIEGHASRGGDAIAWVLRQVG